MKKLILLLLFVPLISFGQTKDELQLCLALQTSGFSGNTEADNSLERILNVIGASKNFVLTPCSEINNVLATSYKGIRYILYDKEFMRLINSRTNDWSSLTILAHEVGHHINGHALDLTMFFGEVVEPKTLAAQRKQELEADEFAGFIMAKLGASLSQVQDAIALISDNKDDTYSTHPSEYKRLNAIKIGFNKAGGNTNASRNDYVVDNSTMSVEHYYNRGKKRIDSKNYYGAIADFNQAIRIKPDYYLAYFYRGWAKSDSQDYSGAIADFSRYIESNPDSYAAYYNRAIAKRKLKDYYGSIADDSKAIELKPDYANAYFNRGLAKDNLKDSKGAIADYNRYIELDPDDASAYYNRGLAKKNLKDYYGAIADYSKAIELKPDYTSAYNNRGVAKMDDLKDNYGAIADYSKAIELDPDYAVTYSNRGIAKENLGDLRGACDDWRRAASLGHSNSAKWVKDQCN
jgi:tetratricopeptide (TPR) repeat protein